MTSNGYTFSPLQAIQSNGRGFIDIDIHQEKGLFFGSLTDHTNAPNPSVTATFTPALIFNPDLIQIGTELAGTHGATYDTENGFTNNQYLDPGTGRWIYWYDNRYNNGVIHYFESTHKPNDNPINGRWLSIPAGPSNNGGTFATCFCAI
jgi:hypothetical protein